MMSKKKIREEIYFIAHTIEQIIEQDKEFLKKGDFDFIRGRINADERTVKWLKELINKIDAPFEQ